MNREIEIRLEPSGRCISAPQGRYLQDLLFSEAVEFPCGGAGTCGKCRVKVVSGHLEISAQDALLLSSEEIADGWRLACQAKATKDCTLELAQWKTQILSDNSSVEVVPRDGWGIVIDLGTTTIVAQLLDLSTGNVLGVRTSMNPQAAFGADVMSRVNAAVRNGSSASLTRLIRKHLEELIRELYEYAHTDSNSKQSLEEIVIVGNTVMHHLFAGHDLTPLSRCPFESPNLVTTLYSAKELEWDFPESCSIRFLPCLAGFIGSDVLAGLIATGMDRSSRPKVLIDLGTNGEIVVTDGQRMLCAATAAGPAFEGARIRMGMRATNGAIDRVSCNQVGADLNCHVLGGEEPQGVCGSGLVDAVACAINVGLLDSSGRLVEKADRLPLTEKVYLHQCDIRELQLAKGAIAAGIEILLDQLQLNIADVEKAFLAGAFGNYLDLRNAVRLGMLPFAGETIHAAGNTALLGAKMALLNAADFKQRQANVLSRMQHVSLNEDPHFMDIYVSNMSFNEMSSLCSN